MVDLRVSFIVGFYSHSTRYETPGQAMSQMSSPVVIRLKSFSILHDVGTFRSLRNSKLLHMTVDHDSEEKNVPA